jgi:hypothetical protein
VERIAQDPEPTKAVAYMRTSSATNVGADKDSERRQRSAIEAYAKRAGITVVEWFYDPAVSGADPIEARPGFSALLDRIEGNGVRVVLIEDASRFARDLIAQETRHRCAGVARGEGHHRKRLPVRYVRPLPRDDAPDRRRIRPVREGPACRPASMRDVACLQT